MRFAGLIVFLLVISISPATAQTMSCAKNAPQLKAFKKVLEESITNDFEKLGLQRVRTSISTRKIAVSSNVRAPRIPNSFGIAVTGSLGADGKPTLSEPTTVGAASEVCTYRYSFRISLRYMNTSGRSTTGKFPARDFQFEAPVIYANTVR